MISPEISHQEGQKREKRTPSIHAKRTEVSCKERCDPAKSIAQRRILAKSLYYAEKRINNLSERWIKIVRHKEQRVGVFVDVQNMYYSAKSLYKRKVNFTSIMREAVAGRKLIRAFAYVIKADMKDESMFHEALEKAGFEVRIKELQVFYGGSKKGDWDVGIAMDVIRMVDKLDCIVLVSGDGDFQELLEYVKAKGCRTEVMAIGRSASSKLKEEADMFIDMGKDTRKFLAASTQKRAPKKKKRVNTAR